MTLQSLTKEPDERARLLHTKNLIEHDPDRPQEKAAGHNRRDDPLNTQQATVCRERRQVIHQRLLRSGKKRLQDRLNFVHHALGVQHSCIQAGRPPTEKEKCRRATD